MNWGDLFNSLSKKRYPMDEKPPDGLAPTLPYTSITAPAPSLPAVADAPPVPASLIPNTPSPVDTPNLNARPRFAAPEPVALPEPRYAPELTGSLSAAPGYDWSGSVPSPSLAPSADVTLAKNAVDEARMRNKYLKANGNPYPDLKYDDAEKQGELDYLQKNSQGSKWKQIGRGILTGMSQSGAHDWGGLLGGAVAGGIWGGVDPTGVAKNNYDRYVFPKIEAQRMREYDQAQQAQKAADDALKQEKLRAETEKVRRDIKHIDTNDELAAKRLGMDQDRYAAAAKLAADNASKKRYVPQQVVNQQTGQSHVVMVNQNDPTDRLDVGPAGQPAAQMALAQYNQGQQNRRADASNQVRVATTAMSQAGQDRRQANKMAADDGSGDEELDGWMQALDDAKNSAMGDPLDLKTGKLKVSIQNAINKLKKYPNVVVGYDDKGWPYAQKTAGAPAQAAPSKVATSQMIQNYAKQHGVTPEIARKKAIADGYTVQ